LRLVGEPREGWKSTGVARLADPTRRWPFSDVRGAAENRGKANAVLEFVAVLGCQVEAMLSVPVAGGRWPLPYGRGGSLFVLRGIAPEWIRFGSR
jgi:hypothetical protein